MPDQFPAIGDDDNAPTVSFGAAAQNAGEGVGNTTVTLTLRSKLLLSASALLAASIAGLPAS